MSVFSPFLSPAGVFRPGGVFPDAFLDGNAVQAIVAVAPRFWGFATPRDELNDAYPGLSTELTAKAAMGAGIERFDFRPSQLWNGSSYDWTTQDAIVAAVRAQGIKIIGVLNGTGTYVGNLDTPEERTFYAGFAAACALRYGSDVFAWEVCNEPNLASTAIAPADYVAALNLSYPAIKAVAPAALVGIGGLASIQSDGSGHYGAAGYLTSIYTGAPNSFDFIAFHAYTDSATIGWRTNDGDAWHSRYILKTGLYGVQDTFGDTKRQFWVTETGMPTGAASSPPTEWWQEKWLRDIHDDLIGDRRIACLLWYSYINRQAESTANGPQDFYGLVKANGDQKRAYPVYQDRASVFVDSTPDFVVSQAASGSVAIPIWRWFQSPTDPRGADLTITSTTLPTGVTLSGGVLTIDQATVAKQASTAITFTASRTGSDPVTVAATLTVKAANLLTNGDYGLSNVITDWTAYTNGTVTYDGTNRHIVLGISGSGGGAHIDKTLAQTGVNYELIVRFVAGTYTVGGALNTFMDGVAGSPSTITPSKSWQVATIVGNASIAAFVAALRRNGTTGGSNFIASAILRMQ